MLEEEFFLSFPRRYTIFGFTKISQTWCGEKIYDKTERQTQLCRHEHFCRIKIDHLRNDIQKRRYLKYQRGMLQVRRWENINFKEIGFKMNEHKLKTRLLNTGTSRLGKFFIFFLLQEERTMKLPLPSKWLNQVCCIIKLLRE